mmetsp:Transcript_26862/g.41985  ORF Transcript_26862/g.41985 Transcript_26862/m.41985 type:complete len:137 (-) Transcript_26862:316-726(-)
MAAGIFEESNDTDRGKRSAQRALAIAKEMIKEAQGVIAPRKNKLDPKEPLQIRVGIHVGDITCGVLGKGMPRFQVFGSAVNMAARMEQSGIPSKIHVSKAFHDLIGEDEIWENHRVVSVKNMGEQETWTLDPLKEA